MATAIVTDGLSKSFGKTEALVSLNLEVPEGEVIGCLGPNGAGKTTTIRLLLGLIVPTAGRAEIFGVDCQADPVQAHRRVAYVPGRRACGPRSPESRRCICSAACRAGSTRPTATC